MNMPMDQVVSMARRIKRRAIDRKYGQEAKADINVLAKMVIEMATKLHWLMGLEKRKR